MNQRPILRAKPKAPAAKKAAPKAKSQATPKTPLQAAPPAAPPAAAIPSAIQQTMPPPGAPATALNKVVLQPGYRPELPSDSLAFHLFGAAHAVAQVRAGTALPQALAKVFGQFAVQAQARGAIQDLAYRAMRQWGSSQALISAMTNKAPEPAMLHALLCCALCLLTAQSDERGYEEFTVVNQTVTAAAAHPDMAHAKGMVNAVLRRFLRERATLLPQVLQQPEAQWNFPLWWIQTLQSCYPKDWQTILRAGNTHPPLTLRVNLRQTTVEEYLQRLAAAAIPARQIGPCAVRLETPLPVSHIPGFEQGMVSVQDAGAQLAAPLLDLQDGMRVLDACAAPGGKTGHLLECANIELTALDNDPVRLQLVKENLDRLQFSTQSATQSSTQLPAQLKAFDAMSKVWWDGQPFDRILADVPCTASGIVRRHPDIRWLRRKNDTLQLATVSARILDNLWQMLRPNGKLLFVTCSIWPQESEAQAAAFAERHQARRLETGGQLLPGTNPDQDCDGLFYALFEKMA